MNLENTKAQMRNGVLELCILNMLQERDAYANEIIEELKKLNL